MNQLFDAYMDTNSRHRIDFFHSQLTIIFKEIVDNLNQEKKKTYNKLNKMNIHKMEVTLARKKKEYTVNSSNTLT